MSDKKPVTSTPPSLVGEKLYLRPATASDIANTHHWYTLDQPERHCFEPQPLRSASDASESFKSGAKGAEQQTFVIVTRKQSDPVGLIGYCHVNWLNRSAEMSVIIDPEEKQKDHLAEASTLLCRHLFNYHGLNRVYVYLSELREDTIKQLKAAGFHEEGTLRQHHYFDGEFHDVTILSLLRFELAR